MEEKIGAYFYFKHMLTIVLSLTLLFLLIWYFNEALDILFKNKLIEWFFILFSAIIFFYSLFSFAKGVYPWLSSQIFLAKIIFIGIVILLVIIPLFYFNPVTSLLKQKDEYKASQLSLSNISSYLHFSESEIIISDLEKKVHDQVNIARTNNGLSALQYDSALSNIARAHSQDMAARNYFEHNSPEGTTAIERGNKANYPCEKVFSDHKTSGIGENLAKMPIGKVEGCGAVYSSDKIAECTVILWMNSIAHRVNLLSNNYSVEGIGITKKNKEYYITQNFC